MKLSINRPELFCWIAMPLVLGIGILTTSQSLDIQLHDTYYVISNLHLGALFAIILGLSGLGYWAVKKAKGSLLRPLSWIHLCLTLGGIFLAFVFISLMDPGAEMQRDYETHRYFNLGLLVALLAFIVSQPLYLVNLLVGFFKRKG